jgi:hypothetical protein
MCNALRLKAHGRPGHSYPRGLVRRKLVLQDLLQIRVLPSGLTEQSMHARQRLDTSAEACREFSGVLCPP